MYAIGWYSAPGCLPDSVEDRPLVVWLLSLWHVPASRLAALQAWGLGALPGTLVRPSDWLLDHLAVPLKQSSPKIPMYFTWKSPPLVLATHRPSG